MKKILSLLTLALLLSVTACQKGGYQINGTIDGAEDGDTIRLAQVVAGNLQDIATAVINNGKFTFQGTQDTAAVRFLVYQTEENYKTAQFFLENADIQVDMALGEPIASVSGTTTNENWTTFQKLTYELNEEGMAIYQRTLDETASEEDREAAKKDLDALEQNMLTAYKEFIQNNIQNAAGQFILANMADGLEDEEFVEAQLAAISDDSASQPIRKLKQQREKAAKTAVGQPFLDIEAATPDGGKNSVSEVAKNAKVLMIDFWASWCGPCRAEMPNVKAAYEKYHAQGFDIIGVSLDENEDNWKKAIADLGMTWPQISDLKGWECEGAQAYAVRAIPATVLIRDGVIVARNVRGGDLEPKIQELLAE